MRSKIEELNRAIDDYADEECDEKKVKELSAAGDDAIRDVTDWLEELEQAWDLIKTREILLLDKIRKTVDPFQEEEDRCTFEFLQQVAPLSSLPQKKAVEVLVEELLAPEIQQGLPKPVFSTDEVHSYLLGKFSNLSRTTEEWVQKLEQAAAVRLGGTRHRYSVLVARRSQESGAIPPATHCFAPRLPDDTGDGQGVPGQPGFVHHP